MSKSILDTHPAKPVEKERKERSNGDHLLPSSSSSSSSSSSAGIASLVVATSHKEGKNDLKFERTEDSTRLDIGEEEEEEERLLF